MTADDYNRKQMEEGRISPAMITKLAAMWQRNNGLEVDGKLGPVTRASLSNTTASAVIRSRDWPIWRGPLDKIPENRTEMRELFGNPGYENADSNWLERNIVTVRDLPGVPSRWHVSLHRLAEPYFREGLRRAQISAPNYSIERFGGFVFRHIRHDINRPLSLHAYGIAADVDSHKNRAIAPQHPIEAWSSDYWKIWPNGLPKAFVEAMCSVGLTWGGDWDSDGTSTDHSFLDPMHFELFAR